jgi:hypothetical protein
MRIASPFAIPGERALPACWFRHSAETNFNFGFHQSSQAVHGESSRKPEGFRQHAASIRSPDQPHPRYVTFVMLELKVRKPQRSFPGTVLFRRRSTLS